MNKLTGRTDGRTICARAAIVVACVALLWSAPGKAGEDQKADQLFETAMSAFKLERWEDAATKFYDFMAASPYDARNDQAQYCIGRCMFHRNYLNKAVQEFGYLFDDFPDSVYTTLGLHYRAQCFLQTRQQDQAVADMERVIARAVKYNWHWSENPMEKQLVENHRSDVMWVAKYYLDNKQPEKAIAAYQKLPNQIEAFRYVVNVYYDLGDFEKIKELIDGLEQTNRHEAFKFMIEFLANKKAYNQLKSIFAKLLEEKNPDNLTDDLVCTTAENFQHFDWDKWEEAMRMVSGHYPREAEWADFRLAQRHWADINYQDELELYVIKYRKGGRADWVDWVLRYKGITLERHAMPEDARKDYQRISNAAQGHWYIAESYHGQFCQKKDVEGAIKEYEKLRTAFYAQEWSAMAQWRIATLLRGAGKVDEAVDAYRHIATRWPSLEISEGNWSGVLEHNLGMKKIYFAPAALLALGDTIRETKRYDDAIMEYRILIQKYGKTEEASWGAFRTGLCYEGLEDADTTVNVFKSVLRRYPKTAAASEAHTRLETRYKVADTEVGDETDAFDVLDKDKKNYIEDPTKMKKRQ